MAESNKRFVTPTIEQTVEIEREVFKQDADSLDLVAVIKAVNGI